MKKIIFQVITWDGEIKQKTNVDWNENRKAIIAEIELYTNGEGTLFIIVDEYMKVREEKKKT